MADNVDEAVTMDMSGDNVDADVSAINETEEQDLMQDDGEQEMANEELDDAQDLQEEDLGQEEVPVEEGYPVEEEKQEAEENTEAGGGEEANEGIEEPEGAKEGGGDEEEEEDAVEEPSNKFTDPNVMPQVNVQTLARRKWQVKVYPLRASDFMTGTISRVFKDAKESLLYLISAGKHSRGKGEMYISSVNQTLKVVQNLMKRDTSFQDVNVEIVKKNDSGVVEEKAYMRYDSALVRTLCNPYDPSFSWNVHGRKRERIIGSIFVKNLPPNTSKDMLRVMFPFAQEINYNPEKFKDGIARLVLKTRSSVIPCLKAFIKVELGGQVLELHPLERKSRNQSGKSDSRKKPRSRSASVEGEKEEIEGKEDKGEESTDKAEGNDEEQKEEGGTEEATEETDEKKDDDKKKSDTPRRGSSKREDGSEKRDRDQDRSRRPFNNRPRGGRGRTDGYRGRGSFTPRGRRGGVVRGMDRRMSGGYRDEMSRNADATKDMLVLQNQLSMAIKSQLTMLNQTKMAVEQAKIEAASTSRARGLDGGSGDRAYGDRLDSRDRRDGYGQKRKAGDAGFRSPNERGYGKRGFKGKSGGVSRGRTPTRGGASSREAEYEMYRRELEDEQYRRELYRAEEMRGLRYGAAMSSYGAAYGDYYDY